MNVKKNERTAGVQKDSAVKNVMSNWFRRDAIGWLLLLPSLICFTIFIWQPLISGIITSFFDTQGFELKEFVGFKNYIDIISDSGFLNAVKNTWTYTLWSVLLGLFTPVVYMPLTQHQLHGLSAPPLPFTQHHWRIYDIISTACRNV